MSARRTVVLDIRELIRQLQAGQSARQIAKNMQLSRVTVGKYRSWAMAHNLLSGAVPNAEDLAALLAQDQGLHPVAPTVSSVEPYRAVVVDLRQRGVEMMAIFQRLRDEHQYVGTYSSVRRFVQALEPVPPEATIRIERPPGGRRPSRFRLCGADVQRGRAAATGLGVRPDVGVQPPSVRRIRV